MRASRFAFALLAPLALAAPAAALERHDVVRRELALAAGAGRWVEIDNVMGGVEVRAGAGDRVVVEIRRSATARRESELDLAFAEVALVVEESADGVALVQDGPFRCGERRRGDRERRGRHGWGGCDWDPDYEVEGTPAVALDDIKRFRQLDSKTPGHPEYRWTSGVETTTGPLGQGIATSVGMAIASQWQAAHFNRPGAELFGFDVYAIAGDGCLMEGVSNEAASIAGHQRLSNLCWVYDNNHITIEGSTRIAFTEDVAARFLGYGWDVQRVGDANDVERIEQDMERDHFMEAQAALEYGVVDSVLAKRPSALSKV